MGNPIRFSDKYGLESPVDWTMPNSSGLSTSSVYVIMSLPMVGGIQTGIVSFNENNQSDIGVFLTLSKPVGGAQFGGYRTPKRLVRAAFGASGSDCGRDVFDGTGAEVCAGGFYYGGCVTPSTNGDSALDSVSIEMGFLLGAEGSATQTWSFTLMDLINQFKK